MSAVIPFDGRPTADRLAARLRRDRVDGEALPVVATTATSAGRTIDVLAIGVFQAGALVAYYEARRDGKVQGAPVASARPWTIPAWTFADAATVAIVDEIAATARAENRSYYAVRERYVRARAADERKNNRP